VKRIIDVYLGEGRVTVRKRGSSGGNKRLGASHIDFIRANINENCTISLKELQKNVNEEFGVSVSKSSINRAISSFNYTLKRLYPVPERRNEPSNIESRFICASWFYSLSQQGTNTIFFLDEAGFNVSMRRRRGRSLSGERAVLTVPCLRNRNISVYCAIYKHGTFLYKKQDRPFNTETFSRFIDELLIKLNSEGISNAILVLDNVPFHKSQVIREKVESTGHILAFLPPYSPFLNPIENMFSQWKDGVKSRCPRSEEELLRLIDATFLNILEENCRNYYENILEYLPRCLRRERIDN
jgi:transposase